MNVKEVLKHDPKVNKEDLAKVSIGYDDRILSFSRLRHSVLPLLMTKKGTAE
jgi:hypothetical protein